MPPRTRHGCCAAVASLLLSGAAHASGFHLHEHSAEAVGRAGAVTAGTKEPAAVWFNPAALAYLDGAGVSLTGSYVRSRTRFSPANGGADTLGLPGNNVVPSLFAHLPVHRRVSVGFGIYAPFGLAVTWPDGWEGAQHSLRTRLWALAANPVVAVRLDERFAVALGVSAYRGGVTFVTDLGQQVGGRADLRGGAWGVGGNLALLWRVRPEVFHAALSYHSRARIKFSGEADFSPQNAVFSEIFADQTARTTVTLPDVITAGVMWRVRPRWELGAELTQVRWSTFRELEIRFDKPATPPINIQRGTRNPLTGRLGGEHTLGPAAFRAGLFLDQSASAPETLVPSTPDAHRLGLSAGAGYARGALKVDVGYLYAHFFGGKANSPRTGPEAPPKGTYRTRVHAASLTLTVKAY